MSATCQHADRCTRHAPGHHIAGRCHIPGSTGCALTELEMAIGRLFRPLADWLTRWLP